MSIGYLHIKKPNIALMLVFSFLFHFLIIFSILLIPVKFHLAELLKSSKRYKFYEVNIVELPISRQIKVYKKGTYVPSVKQKIKAKKEKAIIIPKKRKFYKKSISEEKLIEKAISKIKMRIREKKDVVEQAISKLRREVAKNQYIGTKRVGSLTEGLSISLYKVQIESKIKENWVYPSALVDLEKKDLEAVVILKVKKSGEIVKFWFKKKSNDDIFDNSVIKAIKKSNPLPPFPEGYKKRYEEIEVHFRLSELSSY